MNETELYKELGILTKDKERWEESIPYVSSLLSHESVKIQAKALWLIGEMGLVYPESVKAAVPVIASFLDSKVSLLRERAFNALGRIGRGGYHEESLLKGMTAEERKQQRLAKIKPLLDELFARLETLQVSGNGNLAKAVNYALHEKPNLYTFLEDGNVPLDNNRAENAIRPFPLGRKNWMHCNTANGASCSAILYSIVATAQATGVDTEQYLTELFSQPVGTIILPLNT